MQVFTGKAKLIWADMVGFSTYGQSSITLCLSAMTLGTDLLTELGNLMGLIGTFIQSISLCT
jgi:hypothetical protein